MKKIMLCCSAGMSTSLLVKKMIAEAEQRGLPVEINAFGVAEFDQQVGHYQVVLLGPQVKYMQKDLQKQADKYGIRGGTHQHDGLRHAERRRRTGFRAFPYR